MNKRSEKPKFFASELEKIERKRGRITASIVVEEARDAKHPLHGEFEWRDDVAGQAWREVQARELIRSARLEVTVESVSFSSIAYVRDPDLPPSEEGYRRVTNLSFDRAASMEAVASELKSAAAMLSRGRDIAMALGIPHDQIEQIRANTESLATVLASTVSEKQVA